MDWTGGTRKRFASGRAKAAPNRAQKAHFARMRSRGLHAKSTSMISAAEPTTEHGRAHGSGQLQSRDGTDGAGIGRTQIFAVPGDSSGYRHAKRTNTKQPFVPALTLAEPIKEPGKIATSFDIELQLMQKRNCHSASQTWADALLSRPPRLKLRSGPSKRAVSHRRRSQHGDHAAPHESVGAAAFRSLLRRPSADLSPYHSLDSFNSAEIDFRVGSDALYSQARPSLTPGPHTSLRALSSNGQDSEVDDFVSATHIEASAFRDDRREPHRWQREQERILLDPASPLLIGSASPIASGGEAASPTHLPSSIPRLWSPGINQGLQHVTNRLSPLPHFSDQRLPSNHSSDHTLPDREDIEHEVYRKDYYSRDDRVWREMVGIPRASEDASSTKAIASWQLSSWSNSSSRPSVLKAMWPEQIGRDPRTLADVKSTTSDMQASCSENVLEAEEISPWRDFVFGRPIERAPSPLEVVPLLESWNSCPNLSSQGLPSPIISGLGTSVCGTASEDFVLDETQ